MFNKKSSTQNLLANSEKYCFFVTKQVTNNSIIYQKASKIRVQKMQKKSIPNT